MARYDLSTLGSNDLAMQAGHSNTLFELGMMYCTGRDVEYDLVTAHKWFNLAALRGNRRAMEYRREIAAEMSKSELRAAQREAREWLNRH